MRSWALHAVLVSTLTSVLALAACGGTGSPSGRATTVDDGWDAPRASDEHAPRPDPVRPLPGFEGMQRWPELGRVATGHPGRARRVALRTSPEASGYGRKGRSSFTEGAMLFASLEGSDGGPVVAHYLMRKERPGYFPEGGDWRYAVVSPQGEVLAEGKLGLCARCHAEAPREHVFEPILLDP